jgi:hypothetical protein
MMTNSSTGFGHLAFLPAPEALPYSKTGAAAEVMTLKKIPHMVVNFDR